MGRALRLTVIAEGVEEPFQLERLRKLRDGLARLGLDEDALLQHGMPRRIYLAKLVHGQTHPGARANGRPWRNCGPSAEEVSEFWRERWLCPRLARSTKYIEEVTAFRRETALLSIRLSGGSDEGGRAHGGAE